MMEGRKGERESESARESARRVSKETKARAVVAKGKLGRGALGGLLKRQRLGQAILMKAEIDSIPPVHLLRPQRTNPLPLTSRGNRNQAPFIGLWLQGLRRVPTWPSTPLISKHRTSYNDVGETEGGLSQYSIGRSSPNISGFEIGGDLSTLEGRAPTSQALQRGWTQLRGLAPF
jgi:hypothetical protein